MASNQAKWQEIANRGLQDNFDAPTRAKFDEAVKRGLITLNQPQQVQQPQQEQPVYVKNEGDFVPTDENLAGAVYPEQQDRGIGESIVGAGETALALATGATGGAAGFLSAVPAAVVGELSGRLEQGEGLQEASQRAADFTYAPRLMTLRI